MAEQFRYRTNDYLTSSQIAQVQRLVEDRFKGYVGFSPKEEHRAYFETGELLQLESVKGINIRTISTVAHLNVDQDPFPIFKEVFSQTERTIASNGIVSAGCGFEPKDSMSTSEYFDSVSVSLRKEKKLFSYWPSSELTNSKEHRKNVMSRIIRALSLPINIEEKENDFFLTHSLGGELNISRAGLRKASPWDFVCEINNVSAMELLHLLAKFLQEFASDKRYEYTWSARAVGEPGDSSVQLSSKAIYDFLAESKLPASYYVVDFKFTIESLLGIDTIQELCGPKDEVYIRLCSFDLPPNNYGGVTVITTAGGHQLEIKLRLPEKSKEFESKLGIKFHEIS